jgi:gamma-glutamyl:cysteine ligase YbdK (ATP-grasp superfamily)
MGLIIDRSEFSEEDYRLAGARLQENLRALQMLFARPDFGRGDSSLGAELEMCIVDEQAQALPLNRQVLADSLDPHLQPELDRFNLEYNLSPVMSAGKPFATMRAELETALAELGRIAATHGGRIVPIGILPTLSEAQVQSNSMTDLDRYRALQAGIQRLRQLDFHIRIDGAEPLEVKCDSVTLEGANTSFQVHLRVNPDEFASYYNAAQLATPLALALSANSPFFLGHSLWDETRIALFKQSVDTRGSHSRQWRRAARVPFGHGWARHGALELFAESCHLYPIILPVCGTEDAVGIAEGGGMPELLELRLHQGTIWNWNRAVYDASAGGHVRIEFRALPSGPAPIDMMANAAFLVGLTVGLSKSVDAMLSAFPFRYAEYNFYRAAQHSLQAELLWPTLDGNSPRAVNAATLCAELLETAERGLEIIGVDADERSQLIGIIRERLKSGVTPALWQRRLLARMPGAPREEALVRVVEEYLQRVSSGRPVSEWP